MVSGPFKKLWSGLILGGSRLIGTAEVLWEGRLLWNHVWRLYQKLIPRKPIGTPRAALAPVDQVVFHDATWPALALAKRIAKGSSVSRHHCVDLPCLELKVTDCKWLCEAAIPRSSCPWRSKRQREENMDQAWSNDKANPYFVGLELAMPTESIRYKGKAET